MARSPQVHVLIGRSYNAVELEVTGLAGSGSYKHREDQQGQYSAMSRQQMRENLVARAKQRRTRQYRQCNVRRAWNVGLGWGQRGGSKE